MFYCQVYSNKYNLFIVFEELDIFLFIYFFPERLWHENNTQYSVGLSYVTARFICRFKHSLTVQGSLMELFFLALFQINKSTQ